MVGRISRQKGKRIVMARLYVRALASRPGTMYFSGKGGMASPLAPPAALGLFTEHYTMRGAGEQGVCRKNAENLAPAAPRRRGGGGFVDSARAVVVYW